MAVMRAHRFKRIPSPKATLRREPGAFDLNDACKSAASVTGPCVSIPFERILPPVSCFCPGSARGCHLMGV